MTQFTQGSQLLQKTQWSFGLWFPGPSESVIRALLDFSSETCLPLSVCAACDNVFRKSVSIIILCPNKVKSARCRGTRLESEQ